LVPVLKKILEWFQSPKKWNLRSGSDPVVEKNKNPGFSIGI
jgi:hypothetical protein